MKDWVSSELGFIPQHSWLENQLSLTPRIPPALMERGIDGIQTPVKFGPDVVDAVGLGRCGLERVCRGEVPGERDEDG
jgi:hypothetical protein